MPVGRHALVVLDGALWHQESYNLPNVTILKLPPYSPELNPIEQVWQYISKHPANTALPSDPISLNLVPT